MVHIYTGSGKGKTTSSFGLAMRASGQGFKVIIFQFLKPKSLVTGEEISAKEIKGLKIVKYEQEHPMFKGNGWTPNHSLCSGSGHGVTGEEKIKKSIKKALGEVKKAISGNKYDMVILDEIINAMDQGFCCKKELIELIKKAPEDIEIILTGRGDISEIESLADYVTIMIDKKHPFRHKVNARKGIEY